MSHTTNKRPTLNSCLNFIGTFCSCITSYSPPKYFLLLYHNSPKFSICKRDKYTDNLYALHHKFYILTSTSVSSTYLIFTFSWVTTVTETITDFMRLIVLH